MKKIQTLLKKWEKTAHGGKHTQKHIINTIQKHTNTTISSKQITTTQQTLFIKTSPLTKVEIFIQKKEILKDLKTLLGENAPRDIK